MYLPNYGKATSKKSIDEFAKLAETYDYGSVWTVDHLIIPKEYTSPYGTVLESLSTLAYLAGITEHVMLGTGIIVFPMREVALFAKQAAAIQILSDNRLLLGLGAGWNQTEFESVRADFAGRGQYYDEGIQLFRWLMKGNAEFTGEYYRIADGVFDPVPRKSIPIFIGGNGGQSLRRAAKLGDGWFPVGISPEQLRAGREKLKTLTEKKMKLILRMTVSFSEKGRQIPSTAKSATGEIHTRLAGTSSQILEQIESYKLAGLDHLACYFGDRDAEILKMKAKKFAKEILPSV